MASELSKLIEDELRNNGMEVEDGWQLDDVDEEEAGQATTSETTPLFGSAVFVTQPAEVAHQTLMGALRVEARVKEQSAQRNFSRCQKYLCVGGGLTIVLTIFLLLVIMSSRSRAGGSSHGMPRAMQDTVPGPCM
jgi:hypothetical protein